MRKTIALYFVLCALLYAAAQCFAQVPSSHAGLGTPAVSGGSSVTVDACATSAHSAAGQVTYAFTGQTVGAGLTNGALVFTIAFTTVVTASTAVWDLAGANQSMTKISNATTGSGHVELWGLVNPTAGNKTATFAWTNVSQITVGGCSWSNVNPAGGGTSFPAATPATGTSTAPAITITSATNHAVMAVHTGPDGSYNITAVDHTQVYLDNVTSIGTGANRAAGAATVTLGATFDASVAWTSIGTDISN